VSSIRPLATITVLALVGVFLYLKINETEPPLPEGVEDWSAATDIDFDMVGTDPAAGPQFETSPTGSNAPAFSAQPPAGTSGSGAGAMELGTDRRAAPTWTNPPALNPPSTATSSGPPLDAIDNDESVNNATGNIAAPPIPDLPPLPQLPAATSTPPSEGGFVESTSPNGSPARAAIDAQSAIASRSAQPTFPPVTSETSNATLPTAGPTIPPANSAAQAQSSIFSVTRLAVQAALDRGELSQALLLLSDWHGDPSLSSSEVTYVKSLLGQLAGSVIYSTEHRLEPPYMVQAGERLEMIAKKYDVPWQLLAKINGITSADQLQPGQQLKVMRGPFSALIDISQRKMTLMLDRRYAGRFTLNLDPNVTVEEGQWEVNQKLLTPANVSLPGASPTTSTEERSLMLSSTDASATQVVILRGSTATNSIADPAGRVLRLNPTDAADVFDILSLGSKVVIRR